MFRVCIFHEADKVVSSTVLYIVKRDGQVSRGTRAGCGATREMLALLIIEGLGVERQLLRYESRRVDRSRLPASERAVAYLSGLPGMNAVSPEMVLSARPYESTHFHWSYMHVPSWLPRALFAPSQNPTEPSLTGVIAAAAVDDDPVSPQTVK